MLAKLRNPTVGTKIFGIIILCLVGLIGVAGLAIFQMKQIGGEIEAIAEEDIPLTQVLTRITVHQLEQAINLERALRFGEAMEHSAHAGQQFAHAVGEFEKLADKVDAEIKEGEETAAAAIERAHSEAERQQYQTILTGLQKIETEHADFDHHSAEVLKLLEEGHIEEAVEREDAIEAEAEQLDHSTLR